MYNANLKYNNGNSGNVAEYFDKMHNLIEQNDGTRSLLLRTVDCHDRPAPFDDSQETRISITHSDYDVSCLSDGFLTFNVQLQLQMIGLPDDFDDPQNIL
ncbi:hypothetical protein TRFO_31356 [Tritrichomonas foetus]|uniref:Uncharacterized protein n=1 Tax=Tritrichomonas foetus TaxID=1144522 RepID=A0A1J4JRG5_9EUKA|nr:hypothetical protein TRFO_31356 [Tritrichomonas foetus]|eukprot:OHT01705.1 hypothetical protein TRFO_31356 [Tritrichomonas foetus]